MEPLSGKMKLIIFFIIGSMLVMFADGLFFDNYNTRPSMAMMHMEVRPPLISDPVPLSEKDYFSQYQLSLSLPSNPDEPMEPEIIEEHGEKIKLYRIITQNVLHEIRPGVKVPMISFNYRIPGPTIRITEGDRVRVILYNNATDPHTIHWHGIETLHFTSDGVPDLTQEWVNPGESYAYDFNASPSGTRMYHCHVEAPHHMTMGMFGALIIDPITQHNQANDQTNNNSKNNNDQTNNNRIPNSDDGSPFGSPTKENTFIFSEFDAKHPHVPLPGEMMPMGPDKSILPWLLPGPKFMMAFDPSFDEFMINGKSFPATPSIILKEGDIVRWRLINIGMNVHSIHIHGHHFIVTHRDGFKLPAPFEVDTLLIGPGERYDVWFKANNPGLWMVHDHAGMNAMAKGYDPAGIMFALAYEGHSTEAYDALIERVKVYTETIEHADEDHGMLTPTTSPAGGMMDMGGMDMGGMSSGMEEH